MGTSIILCFAFCVSSTLISAQQLPNYFQSNGNSFPNFGGSQQLNSVLQTRPGSSFPQFQSSLNNRFPTFGQSSGSYASPGQTSSPGFPGFGPTGGTLGRPQSFSIPPSPGSYRPQALSAPSLPQSWNSGSFSQFQPFRAQSAPSAPQSYTPSAPAQQWGAPAAPAQQFSSPAAPAHQWSTSGHWNPPSAPAQQWSQPSAPASAGSLPSGAYSWNIQHQAGGSGTPTQSYSAPSPPPAPVQSYSSPPISQPAPQPAPQLASQQYRSPQNSQNFNPAPVHYASLGRDLQGDYKFGYHTGDGGSFREETRNPDGSVQGAYGFVDADGKQRVVKYTAGKDGFKAEGDDVPRAAPVSASAAPSGSSHNWSTDGQWNPPSAQPQQWSQPSPSASPQQYSAPSSPSSNLNLEESPAFKSFMG